MAALLSISLVLGACGAPPPPDNPGPSQEVPVADPDGGFVYAEPFEPVEEGDLPPCPGINPDIRRPAGSNCLGITPDTCGADEAQRFVGKEVDLRTREMVSQLAKGDIRWIGPETAQNDDLRPDRMNVLFDEFGVISKIDCY